MLDLREKLADLDKYNAPRDGVEVIRSLLVEAQPLVGGASFRPPASMPHLARNVLEAVS